MRQPAGSHGSTRVVQVPGDDKAVTAVVAAAADNRDCFAFANRPAVPMMKCSASAGVLHQNDTGDAGLFDGGAIDVADFLASKRSWFAHSHQAP